jgi:catechol-2,3-dioxygenase
VERPFVLDHLDHLVLRVRDLERSVGFYSLLGGKVCIRRPGNVSLQVGSSGTRVTLQHAADYQPPTTNSIDHVNFAVEARDIAEVASYLRAQGVEVFAETGPHTSPSIRMRDPDDNVVEIRLAGPDAAVLQTGALPLEEQV